MLKKILSFLKNDDQAYHHFMRSEYPNTYRSMGYNLSAAKEFIQSRHTKFM